MISNLHLKEISIYKSALSTIPTHSSTNGLQVHIIHTPEQAIKMPGIRCWSPVFRPRRFRTWICPYLIKTTATLNATIANPPKMVASMWITSTLLIRGMKGPAVRRSPSSLLTMVLSPAHTRMCRRPLSILTLALGLRIHPSLSGRRPCSMDLFGVIILLARGLGNVLRIRGMLLFCGLNLSLKTDPRRKHEARHRKLFKCDEPNCPRKEGFGTINDLARHKKCVHNKEPERGPKMMYMCFGTNCPRPNKRWPRLDNFKQHLNRMHHDEDGEVLLKKWVQHAYPSPGKY